MDVKEFIERVVPSDGVYFLATPTKVGSGKTVFKHATFKDVNAIPHYVDEFVRKHKDVYFATASFTNDTKRNSANLKSKKGLYLDLDCGEGKSFPTQKDAAQALAKFVAATGIPKWSFILNSGNGLHVHWTFANPLSGEQWQMLADALRKKCYDHGFNIDGGITVDSVRLLRVPGSVNFKDPAHPKRCFIVGKDNGNVSLARMMKVLMDSSTPVLTVVPKVGVSVDNSDLGTLREYEQPPAAKVFKACPTLKARLENNGKDDNEAMWAQILHVLAYLPDGKDFIHEIGKAHPTYGKRDTEYKFAQKVKAVENKATTGPVSCNTFSLTAGNCCNDCPFYGQAKNPIHAASFTPATEPPSWYKVLDNGMYRVIIDDDGNKEWVKFTDYKFHKAVLNQPIYTTEQTLRLEYEIGMHNIKNIEIPCSDINTSQTFSSVLGYNNLIMTAEEIKGVQRLMADWTKQMAAAKCITHAPNRMGWTRLNSRNGFALAEKIVWEDGTETPNPIPHLELLRYYKPVGELDKWKAAADLIIGHPNIELQVVLASAFASPLMSLAGTPGAVLALVSEDSGLGKTKAIHTAQSVWGKPDQINSMDDTGNSVIKKMGILNNMPAYWDELHLAAGNDGIESFTNTVFRLAQGKEKTRLRSNTSFQDSGSWSTIITLASNDSVSDSLSAFRRGNQAADMRVLELEVRNAQRSPTELSTALKTFLQLDTNYGVAGYEFSKYLVKHHDDLRNKVHAMIAKLAAAPHMGGNERMRIALSACLIVGARAANDAGLTNFDVKGIAGRLWEVIKPRTKAGKKVDTRATAMDVLLAYIDAHAEHVLKVDSFGTKGGFSSEPVVISAPNRLPVRVQVVENPNIIRIDRAHFKNWVTTHYGSGDRYIRELFDTDPRTNEVRGSLDRGLPSSITTNRTRNLEIHI
jgi:hypothetical protein